MRKISFCFAVFALLMIFSACPASAAKKGSKFYYKNGSRKTVIGVYKNKNTVTYKPSKNPTDNYVWLNAMLAKKGKLTIVIPSGSKFKINGKLTPTSNKTIIATGATITMKPKTYVMMTNPKKKIHDLKIVGGKWRSPDKGGRKGSMFQFAFAKNITMDGCDVEANFDGHSIEIIACKNVTIKNCKVRAIGKNPVNGKEEQIQIDVASKATAPMVAKYGKKYIKGQTCSNIKILNNDVYGARAVGVNYYKKFKTKYHKNIVIKGNRLHGTTSEAIQYFNVVGGEISDNTIRTDATRSTSNYSYTIAVHIQNNGKAPAAMASSRIDVKDNVIYGNRNGIYVKGYFTNWETQCPGRFGTIDIENNTVYYKMSSGIGKTRGSAAEWIEENNQELDWTSDVTPEIDFRKGWK